MKMEYLLIKAKDDFCISEKEFQHLLLTNSRIQINGNELTLDNYKFNLRVISYDVEDNKEVVFHLILDADGTKEHKEQIEALETIDRVLRRFTEKYPEFYMNTIWDDISPYYSCMMYPKINSIENKMRKVIYFFMIKNIGSKWIEKNIPKEVRQAIKENQKKNNIHNILEDCLSCADFIQLRTFFFDPYPLNSDMQLLVRKIKAGKEDTQKLVETFESKSNWERFFSSELNIDELPKKWNELYHYRNKIAHNRNYDKDDYNETNKLCEEIENELDRCIAKACSISITEEEKIAVETIAEHSIEKNLVTELISNVNRTTNNKWQEVFEENIKANFNFTKHFTNLLEEENKPIQLLNYSDLSKNFHPERFINMYNFDAISILKDSLIDLNYKFNFNLLNNSEKSILTEEVAESPGNSSESEISTEIIDESVDK